MLQWFIRFSEFTEFSEFNESSAPFRENPIEFSQQDRTAEVVQKY